MKIGLDEQNSYRHPVGFKLFFLTVIALLFVSVMGCFYPDDKKYLDDLSRLKQKYGVSTTFSVNLVNMNDYIAEASVLAGSATPPVKKIIEVEVYSAQAFYHLSKALDDSSNIPYPINNCNSRIFKSTLSNAILSKNYSAKAISLISSLFEEDLKYLREGQLEAVKDYESKAGELISVLKEKC